MYVRVLSYPNRLGLLEEYVLPKSLPYCDPFYTYELKWQEQMQ
nr:hypothetical protein Q903MT_gene6032 [Picea sitchensis]